MLDPQFDSVVMLTWSNWRTESRKNRYHYATRFAKLLPVIFVQPDLQAEEFFWEQTEVPNVKLLHIYDQYNMRQSELLNQALQEVKRPLWWIYNSNFYSYIKYLPNPFIVYHATEDYFSPDFPSQIQKGDERYKKLIKTVENADLMISVSPGVEENYLRHVRFRGKSAVVTNGCDYKFYSERAEEARDASKNIALFQGLIFAEKVDFALVERLLQKMTDWEFWFCGPVGKNEPAWRRLFEYSNFKYLGNLHVDQLREVAYQAAVGIMPFAKKDYVKQVLFPLKTFEYLACGLPVVTTPIHSLIPYSDVVSFAEDVHSFEKQIREAGRNRFQKEHLSRRLECAKLQDYDIKFQTVCSHINACAGKPKKRFTFPFLNWIFKRTKLNEFFLRVQRKIHRTVEAAREMRKEDLLSTYSHFNSLSLQVGISPILEKKNESEFSHRKKPIKINKGNQNESMRIRNLIQKPYSFIDWSQGLPGHLSSERILQLPQEGAWPLARLSHFADFRNQMLDFIAANPPRFGIHWISSAEVGIRMTNCLLNYDSLRSQGVVFDREFERVFARSMFEHGHHIFHHLNWNPHARGCDYLINLAALIIVSVYCPIPETVEWIKFATRELASEINNLDKIRNDPYYLEAQSVVAAAKRLVPTAFVSNREPT